MNAFSKLLENRENYSHEFKDLMSQVPTCVAVVAASTTDGIKACTVSSFVSVDVLDPTVIFVLKNESGTLNEIVANSKFSINLLLDDQDDLSRIYASIDKNSANAIGSDWKKTGDGVPVLTTCKSSLVCQAFTVTELPSATVVFARVMEFELRSKNLPLIYYSRTYPRIVEN